MRKQIYLIALLFSLVSCGGIIDEITNKVCDLAVKELNEEYDQYVQEVKDDTTLSEEEKTIQIADYEEERKELIAETQQDCDEIIQPSIGC